MGFCFNVQKSHRTRLFFILIWERVWCRIVHFLCTLSLLLFVVVDVVAVVHHPFCGFLSQRKRSPGCLFSFCRRRVFNFSHIFCLILPSYLQRSLNMYMHVSETNCSDFELGNFCSSTRVKKRRGIKQQASATW